MSAVRIRAIDLGCAAEMAAVVRGMAATLDEVVGVDRGVARYDADWLEDRVRQHLDGRLDGAVFVAVDGDPPGAEGPAVVGHTIVRADRYDGAPIGLFSTTWVVPIARRRGVASRLLDAGEAWLTGRGLSALHTCTAITNHGLRALFDHRGYRVIVEVDDMVRLARVP